MIKINFFNKFLKYLTEINSNEEPNGNLNLGLIIICKDNNKKDKKLTKL